MDYLQRPVFTFAIDWTAQPSIAFDFDLAPLNIGFQAATFTPNQIHVARGFEFSCRLLDENAIADFHDFFDALLGPLRGFWLPGPQALARILELAGVTTETIDLDIAPRRLSDTWQNHPSSHVICAKAGATAVLGQITAVADHSTFERVTITTANPAAVDASWTILPLHYVRLANDEETAAVDAEQRLTAKLRVIELPTEYAETEAGRRPIYLYTFTAIAGGQITENRYTSFWQNLNVNGLEWETCPISHGALSSGTKGDKESVQIETAYMAAHPLAQFIPFTLPGRLLVTIREEDFSDLPGENIVFTGEIESVEVKGQRIVARCNSLLDVLSRKLPNWQIQPRCPYQTFEAATCKLNRADWLETADIETVNGRVVDIHNLAEDLADDYFSFGLIEAGTGVNYEARSILADFRLDADSHRLILARELIHATAATAITLLPGDDHRGETCAVKFGNHVNFGGHEFVPRKNLTIQAIQAKPSAAGKK